MKTEAPLISLKSIPCVAPYECYLLPVSEFPIPDAELSFADAFLRRFCTLASGQWNLSEEVFLQLEQMESDESRYVIADHGKAWLPETGLGVWVDREPPRKWSWEELTSLLPGDRPRPLMFQVFRISTSKEARMQARSAMLRYGSILEILQSYGESYLARVKSIFKAGIVDPSYTCFPYYVGLLEGKTMANASSEQLDRWFEGVTVYIRESFEDQGILIASAAPVSAIFEEIGGTLKDPGWVFSE